MKQLAIVIPAYKIDFFRATLDSLAAQTCKDFTVYIGDDCSSADFRSLVDEYSSQLNIVYKRFDTNLGGKDLVAQWTRCIKMTQGEPWIWLFSDDDVVGKDCVLFFYNELKANRIYDLYHFNVKVINEQGEIIKHPRIYPELFSSEEFYRKKLTAKVDSFVVEYIFSREIYDKIGGFVRFDMAWGSDIATWIAMGVPNGIKSIQNEYVYWRNSSKNITPNYQQEIVKRKLHSAIAFVAWTNDFFKKRDIFRFNHYAFFRIYFFYIRFLEKNQMRKVIEEAYNKKIITKCMMEIGYMFYPILLCIRKLKK